MPTISRLFDDYASARQALQALVANGIPEADISIVANNSDNFYNDRSNLVDRDKDGVDDRAEGAGTGGGVGAAAGGTLGLLTGLGIMAIPGVGPVVAAGWLATTALGALAGGAAGSIIGALVESGVHEEDAHVYAEGLRRGGVLLTVRTDSATPTNIERILDQYAVDTRARAEDYRRTGWKNFDETSSPYTADQIKAERDLRP
jgi:hypothetical protein